MRIHKEGASIILITAVFAAVVMVSAAYLLPSAVAWAVAVAALACVVFVTSFFRCPSRPPVRDENGVYSPADGTVVALEEVEENEYFHDTRIVVSVFMSIWNVHVNWFPVSGTVDYFRHHHGMFMVAWHPKSSEDNERTTTVVRMPSGQKVLFRQIAGLIARRIISYMTVGHQVEQNSVCGFIKFGSRVDVLVPKDSELLVEIGDPTVGSQTPIARLRKNLENE